jgi:hypothetical protein
MRSPRKQLGVKPDGPQTTNLIGQAFSSFKDEHTESRFSANASCHGGRHFGHAAGVQNETVSLRVGVKWTSDRRT